MRYLLVLLVACGNKPAPVQEEKKPSLESFREPAQHLSKGMTAFVQGKDLAEAMKPWSAQGRAAEIRDQLKAKNAAAAVLVSIEFEIYLMKAGKGIYGVRAAVVLGEKECSLLQYEAGPSGGRGELGLKDMPDGFSDAVRAILKGGDLPFADAKDVVKSAGWPAEAEREFSGMISEGKEAFAAKKAEVAAVSYDDITVEVDDILLVAIDKDGKAVGIFKGRFGIEDGKFTYKLDRLKD